MLNCPAGQTPLTLAGLKGKLEDANVLPFSCRMLHGVHGMQKLAQELTSVDL